MSCNAFSENKLAEMPDTVQGTVVSKKICKGINKVPLVHSLTKTVYWNEYPCQSEALDGSDYCQFHGTKRT